MNQVKHPSCKYAKPKNLYNFFRIRTTKEPKVYNFTYTCLNPGVCWKTAVEFSLKLKDVFPFDRSVWYTSFFYTESTLLNEFFWYLLHRIPGACFDKLAELTGATPG